MTQTRIFAAFAAAFALCAWNALAAAATLTIVAGDQRRTFSQSQLLSRSDVRTLSIADSVYQRRFTRFEAIPIADLFKGLSIPRSAVIQCNGTDGFSAILGRARLFGTDPAASQAFLAIEDPKHPWPHLAGGTTSAGPFYLVWTNPRASAIGSEEWPYKIASLHVLPDARSVFPKIYPAADAPRNVQRGFRSFQKNCSACHTMNGEGGGSVGPDLNLPMNPTRYFAPAALVRFIRDPSSVRHWPRMTMHGFSAAAIPDPELADLIAYLRYMKGHRNRP